MKKFIIIGVVAVMGVFGVAASMNKPEVVDTIGGDKEGPRVQVERVKRDSISATISSSGGLEATNTETIYLDASNKVVTINKEVGDVVKKGETILVLDEKIAISSQKNLESLEAQLKTAKQQLNLLSETATDGELLSAKANLTNLKNTKTRTESDIKDLNTTLSNLKEDLVDANEELKAQKELFDIGAISEKDLEKFEDAVTQLTQKIDQTKSSISNMEATIGQIDLQIKSAQYNYDVLTNKIQDSNKNQQIISVEGQIKGLESQIYNAKNNMDKVSTSIESPMDGVITFVPEEGMPVSPGTKVLTVVDPSRLEVICDISPYYAPDLKLGLKAEIKYTGSKTVTVPGEITKVAAVAQVQQGSTGETVSIPVKVEIPQPGDIIKPGFSVDVKITTDTRENILVAPILAVMEDDNKEYYVYVVAEDGTLSRRDVKQGLSSGLYTEIEGVEEGEMLVSNPADYLAEGVKVSYEKLGDN